MKYKGFEKQRLPAAQWRTLPPFPPRFPYLHFICANLR